MYSLSRSRRRLFAVLVALLPFLAACNLSQEVQSPTGTLSVTLPGGAEGRMTFQAYVDSLSMYLKGSGPESLADQRLKTGENRFSLAPGQWSLSLSVRNKAGELVGGDTKTVTIEPEKLLRVDFVIKLTNPDPEFYTIAFDDGDDTTGNEKLKVPWKDANKTPTLRSLDMELPAPQYSSGMFFQGWETEEGEAFTEDTPVSGDMTLYARWTDTVPVFHITLQPEDLTVIQGAIAGYLTVEAEVTQGAAALSYHWYQAAEAGGFTGNDREIAGALGKRFTIPSDLAAGTYYYFCEVRAGMASPVRSAIATIRILEPGSSSVIIAVTVPNGDPTLVEQRAEASAGRDKTFTLEGDWIDYQWYLDNKAIAGGTGPSYTFNQEAGIYNLTATVKNSLGDRYSGSCMVTVE